MFDIYRTLTELCVLAHLHTCPPYFTTYEPNENYVASTLHYQNEQVYKINWPHFIDMSDIDKRMVLAHEAAHVKMFQLGKFDAEPHGVEWTEICVAIGGMYKCQESCKK